jgi:hypothetical protein
MNECLCPCQARAQSTYSCHEEAIFIPFPPITDQATDQAVGSRRLPLRLRLRARARARLGSRCGWAGRWNYLPTYPERLNHVGGLVEVGRPGGYMSCAVRGGMGRYKRGGERDF